MSKKKIVKIPEELADRIDDFVTQKGRSMGLENRTELVKRAVDKFISDNE